MKNLLLTTILMLAVIFSSNATNDVNGPAKKVSILEQGQPSLFPSITLHSKPIKIKQVTPSPTGASVVVAVFVA